MKTIIVGVIGNPNSGKSTVFNELTGLNQKTGNWSGVTVEKRIGTLSKSMTLKQGHIVELIDLPGLYSLSVVGKKSLDQNIALNFITQGDFDYLLYIADSTNFKRSLYLILQLLERNIPVILVLNMDDLAKKKGIIINEKKLSKTLNCSVIKISAKNTKDIAKLRNLLALQNQRKKACNVFNLYPKKIRECYADLEYFLKSNNYSLTPHEKLALIEGNLVSNKEEIKKFQKKLYNNIEQEFEETIDFVMVNSRYEVIDKITKEALKVKGTSGTSFADQLDSIFLNRFLGLPLFLLAIYLMFIFSINLGGAFQDFFNLFARATFVDVPLLAVNKIYSAEWLNFTIQGIGGGIQTVASFIPIIFAMYVFLSFLEDSGYIARTAVIANKLMKSLQLPGQSFFPLMLGLGCNVPAITGARILSNHRERISTIMMSPFISCTARLAVYMLFCFIFFPHNTQNIIFFLYVIGIIVAIITGLLIKNKSFDISDSSIFIELPEYKWPKLKSVINSSILRTKSFALGAGKTIIVVFFIIHIINVIKIPISNKENISDTTLIHLIGQKMTPIFEPLGLKEKNWAATVGIFTGIFAKEVVVGTLTSLYANDEHDEEDIDIIGKYKEAIISIPKKLGEALTINAGILDLNEDEAKNEYYEANKISNTVIKNIHDNFEDKLAVLAYLIFILLYLPCVSVFGAINNEIGKKWAIASALWSTVSAYAVAVIFYQAASAVINNVINYNFLLLGIFIFAISAFCLRLFSRHSHNKEAFLQ